MRSRIALFAALLFVLGGCSDAGTGGNAGGAPRDSGQGACLSPATASQRIAEGFKPESGATRNRKSGAVASSDFPGVYLVAVQFSMSGEDNFVGVWATTNLDTGPIMSVDDVALEVSTWPQARQGDVEIGESTDVYGQALTCVR